MKVELESNSQTLQLIQQEIIENKKFKLPWTLVEIQNALTSVLKKFE
jgi:hypothetical protein